MSEQKFPELTDLKSRLESPKVRELLLLLVGWRDDAVLDRAAFERAVSAYRHDATRQLYGAFRQGRRAGLIGLEVVSA